jgi:hypothetical protein
MVMAGTRIPQKGGGTSAHFGRYHDDVGECHGMQRFEGRVAWHSSAWVLQPAVAEFTVSRLLRSTMTSIRR